MGINLPAGTVTFLFIDIEGSTRLGEDLTAPFPLLPEHIANPNLLALLREIDPTQDSTRGSGAKDWGNLHNRLHFIADILLPI